MAFETFVERGVGGSAHGHFDAARGFRYFAAAHHVAENAAPCVADYAFRHTVGQLLPSQDGTLFVYGGEGLRALFGRRVAACYDVGRCLQCGHRAKRRYSECSKNFHKKAVSCLGNNIFPIPNNVVIAKTFRGIAYKGMQFLLSMQVPTSKNKKVVNKLR